MTEILNAVNLASVGRPSLAGDPLDTKITSVRLTVATRARIEAAAGPNRMAEFIRDAVEEALARRSAANTQAV